MLRKYNSMYGVLGREIEVFNNAAMEHLTLNG